MAACGREVYIIQRAHELVEQGATVEDAHNTALKEINEALGMGPHQPTNEHVATVHDKLSEYLSQKEGRAAYIADRTAELAKDAVAGKEAKKTALREIDEATKATQANLDLGETSERSPPLRPVKVKFARRISSEKPVDPTSPNPLVNGSADVVVEETPRSTETPSATEVPKESVEAPRAESPVPPIAEPSLDFRRIRPEETSADYRKRAAEGLPEPIKMTLGETQRDEVQLGWEKKMLVDPIGEELRRFKESQNVAALENFKKMNPIDEYHADSSTTGRAVVQHLENLLEKHKDSVRAAYKTAKAAPEAYNIVDPNKKIEINIDGDPTTTSLAQYLNEQTRGLRGSEISDIARQALIKMGMAVERKVPGGIGYLDLKQNTVGGMEALRKQISRTANAMEPTQIRQEIILENLIDAHTKPVSGPLFRQARALRSEQSNIFDSHRIIADLVHAKTGRLGTADARVPLPEVFNKTILHESPQNIRILKNLLLTSGEEGAQAWKEIQAATIQYMFDESTNSNALDKNNRPIVSSSALSRVVGKLDHQGKLDIIFGERTANHIRDLNDVLKWITTVPPGTLINSSGTAWAVSAALGEMALMGGLGGLPVPALSALRFIVGHIKNKSIERKILRAINNDATPEPNIPDDYHSFIAPHSLAPMSVSSIASMQAQPSVSTPSAVAQTQTSTQQSVEMNHPVRAVTQRSGLESLMNTPR